MNKGKNIEDVRRIDNISNRQVSRRLSTDNAKTLPPSTLELYADLDTRRVHQSLDGILLTVVESSLLQVDHAKASERHGADDIAVLARLDDLIVGVRALSSVESDSDAVSAISVFDDGRALVQDRFGGYAICHRLVHDLGTTTVDGR